MGSRGFCSGRLDETVVRSDLQPEYLIHQLAACRQHKGACKLTYGNCDGWGDSPGQAVTAPKTPRPGCVSLSKFHSRHAVPSSRFSGNLQLPISEPQVR